MEGKVGRWTAFVGLALALALAVGVRTFSFQLRGYTNEDLFYVESAQHFRYTKMIAEGKPVPRLDVELEYPEGFSPHTDAITGELFWGYLYRWLHAPIPLETFARYCLRSWFSLTLLPIYLLTVHYTRRRSAGLAAAVTFAVAGPAVDRSTGNVLLREHFALPFLGMHLYFFVRALSASRCSETSSAHGGPQETPLGSSDHCLAYATLSAGFLLMAMVGWMVLRFYYLIFALFFLVCLTLDRDGERMFRMLLIAVLANVAGSLALPVHLQYRAFYFSTGMLLSYGLVAALFARSFLKVPRWGALVLLCAVVSILAPLLPYTGHFGHVRDTLFAKLRYWSKPADPTLLSFDARHYWVPPYTSPTLYQVVYDFSLPLVACALPLGGMLRAFLAGRLPLDRLFLAYTFSAFLCCYLLFYKLETLLIVAVAVLVGIAFGQMVQEPRWRWPVAVLLALIFVTQAHGSLLHARSPLARLLMAARVRPMEIPEAVTDLSVRQLLAWLKAATPSDSVILAEFAISPMIPLYSGRTVILHSFFESPMREKYRLFSYALFGPEDSLHSLCLSFGADYLVHDAHILLRTDSNLSYRYVTAHMELDTSWAAYKMHFAPERLRHFEFVYQNPFFRVFRVLAPGEEPRHIAADYAPVFDWQLFDPEVPKGEAFLYTIVSAYREWEHGERLLRAGQEEAGARWIRRSIRTFAYLPEAYLTLAEYHFRKQQWQEAAEAYRKVLELNPQAREPRERLESLERAKGVE